MKPWRSIELGNVVTFQRGFDLPHRHRKMGGVPIVSSAGITDHHDAAMVSPPGVVTGRYGTIGELFYLEGPFWPLNTTLFVRDFHGNDPRFAFYLLHLFDFQVFSGKSGVPGVNRNDLHAERVTIPTNVAEQSAIASALSDVDALLSSLDALIAKKRDIKQAAMQQLLTGKTRLPGFSGEWEVKRIGDVLRIRHGKDQKAVISSSGQYPVLATGGQIGWAKQWLYNRPSVLIGRKGTIDRPQYMDQPFWTVDTLFYSELTSENVAKYFYYRFCLIDWLQYNEASGVPSLNARTIETIELACPVPEEQTAIAKVLSDMDAELAALEARRDKTRLLKQGMMQELLTGKIRLV
ncbi:restriction endonuclease subunit S [Burkholderia ubonensis]|uniref:restriction endonuclease subunit S n=1 Tax=Burkholderia ubonensis TaxID=101571 RepID=UPI0009B46103|nr:restriction endonuclease subunit S [Burkholderia ubonensis]